MSGLVQYEDADLKNRVNVSEQTPMPVSAPQGLSVTDPAIDDTGALTALPATYTLAGSDTTAPATKTFTITSTAPGDVRVFEQTITYHASGEVDTVSDWVQQ